MFRNYWLIFLLFVSYVYCDPYTCSGEQLINAPNNLTIPWYYPDGWMDGVAPMTFAANQNCTWKINVPKGLFAYLTITGVTNSSTTLTVTDSVGNSDWVPSMTNQEPYFLLNPQFSVGLSTKSEGTLGLKVVWRKIGSFNPSSVSVIPNTVPIMKASEDCDSGLLIYSTTNVSLVSIRPPTKMENINLYMRNTVVFDGRSMDDKLIGNLWQIYQKDNHVVSSGGYLTLYSFIPCIKTVNYVLVQDYQNVKQFSTYKGVSCFDENLCPVIIDARNGTGAAVRMSYVPHYLEEVNMADGSTLTVYSGTVVPSHQLAQYTTSEKLTAAQKFNGLFTTYTVDKVFGIIYQSVGDLDSNWTSIFDGKNGVLASKNYGDSSSDQNVQERFTGPETDIYRMELNLKNAGLNDDATLSVSVTFGGNTVFNEKYTSKQLPPQTISTSGNVITINYVTNGSKTNGIFINFDFKLESSTGTTKSSIVPTSVPSTRFTSPQTPETTTKFAARDSILLPVACLFFLIFLF